MMGCPHGLNPALHKLELRVRRHILAIGPEHIEPRRQLGVGTLFAHHPAVGAGPFHNARVHAVMRARGRPGLSDATGGGVWTSRGLDGSPCRYGG